jgi:nitrile hydratase beta subunit-like protein
MGGMHGMGPAEHEKNEPVFHARWEAGVYALVRATGAWSKWNIDAGRLNIVDRPPRGVSVLPDVRRRRLPLHHRTHRADKLVNAHAELVNAAIGLDTTLGKRNHRLIKAFDVVGQFIDTPRERTHNRFKSR